MKNMPKMRTFLLPWDLENVDEFKSSFKFHFYGDVLQQLIVECVGAVELQHNMLRKDVLDALNDVLRLRF